MTLSSHKAMPLTSKLSMSLLVVWLKYLIHVVKFNLQSFEDRGFSFLRKKSQ